MAEEKGVGVDLLMMGGSCGRGVIEGGGALEVETDGGG